MQINKKGIETDLTPSFNRYVDQKLGDLAKLVKHFDEEGSAEMWFEIIRVSKHHRQKHILTEDSMCIGCADRKCLIGLIKIRNFISHISTILSSVYF